ncbi:hypothetical protein PIB30_072487, partial [Stylosanthes scabra]|nr:hypothetical protein [Stylosanthes scabra]
MKRFTLALTSALTRHIIVDASPFLQSAFAMCPQPADVDDDVATHSGTLPKIFG